MNNKLIMPDIEPVIEACFNIYQEIGNQTGGTRQVLLRKIISHLEAIRILLLSQFTHDIKIIIRSAQESVVLFCYLTQFPDKEQEYIYNSQIIDFRNHFIALKNFKTDIEYSRLNGFDWDKAVAEHTNNFKLLVEENQQYILKQLQASKYEITKDNFNKIDKFFRNDKKFRKPFFCDLEEMYKKISPIPHLNAELRDLIYSDYNINSQIAHGHWHTWVKDIDINEYFLDSIKSQINRVINIPIIYVNGKVIITAANQLALKKAIENIIFIK